MNPVPEDLLLLRKNVALFLAIAVEAHFRAEDCEGIFRYAGSSSFDDEFHCDFALPRSLRPDDLPPLESAVQNAVPAAVKLLAVGGAQDLQRIYVSAWRTPAELDAYLAHRAELEQRDHRKIGKELELFFFHPTAPGMPYWLPKGLKLYQGLLEFWRGVDSREGWEEIASPVLNDKKLWEISGHWEHYKNDMFLCPLEGGQILGLKPMNCPNAMVVFNHRQRSYRDLPMRLSDCDMLHRRESSGTLHGLMRVQKFQQDDGHVFLAEDQIEAEIRVLLGLVKEFYELFGLKHRFRIGTRPKAGFLGKEEDWDHAEAQLKKFGFDVAEGEGAFYGPKIDILIDDALGRAWQMGTIQLDFQIPQRFGCTYIDRDGKKKVPVVIHRAIYGSLERFIGILIEHTAGHFPLWLAPVQVRILAVADRHAAAAQCLRAALAAQGVRAEADVGDASVGAKIRKVQQDKIPYAVVYGDKEAQSGIIRSRGRDGQQQVWPSFAAFSAWVVRRSKVSSQDQSASLDSAANE